MTTLAKDESIKKNALGIIEALRLAMPLPEETQALVIAGAVEKYVAQAWDESLAAHSAKLQRLVTAAREHLRSNSAASSVELSAALDMKEVENATNETESTF